jgi:diaminopimelate decarboxylase
MSSFNNIQSIQGIDLISLARQYGTPLYVYDGDVIRRQVSTLKRVFSKVDLRIKFACKANTNLALLKLMKTLGVGLDVVSLEEFRLAEIAGYTAGEVTYTPSGADFDEIEKAIEAGLTLNADSLPLLKWFGERYGADKPCMIRIKPNVAAGGNKKIMTAHSGSKFGISVLLLDQVLDVVKEYGIRVTGLHQHTGSDIKDAEPFLEVAEVIFKVALQFPDLEVIDLGGGFKVSYRPDDAVTDMDALGDGISERFHSFCKEYGRDLALWVEPGKFLVSECGVLLVKTTVVKEDPARTFVHVDSGLNHLIRPMMYDAYHHIENLSNPEGSPKSYQVVGYICETDNFAEDRSLPEVRQGDILALRNAGAYGFSMSSNYNSRFRPAEVLVDGGGAKLVRRRETIMDLLSTQTGLEDL